MMGASRLFHLQIECFVRYLLHIKNHGVSSASCFSLSAYETFDPYRPLSRFGERFKMLTKLILCDAEGIEPKSIVVGFCSAGNS